MTPELMEIRKKELKELMELLNTISKLNESFNFTDKVTRCIELSNKLKNSENEIETGISSFTDYISLLVKENIKNMQ